MQGCQRAVAMIPPMVWDMWQWFRVCGNDLGHAAMVWDMWQWFRACGNGLGQVAINGLGHVQRPKITFVPCNTKIGMHIISKGTNQTLKAAMPVANR